jgi:putative FmdB family regulatory protein
VPIYVYGCSCGLRFERLAGFDDAAPDCPSCGGETRKVPTAVGLSGRADPGLAKDAMPQTWRGVHEGNREYVTGMRRQWERRQKLEANHPELAGDQRPILAHEGRYSAAPLRAGDAVLGGGPGAAAGDGHGHGHGHGHGGEPSAPPAPAAD